jgi:hypothetical protein
MWTGQLWEKNETDRDLLVENIRENAFTHGDLEISKIEVYSRFFRKWMSNTVFNYHISEGKYKNFVHKSFYD